jgi:hypothetical protein
MDGPLSRDPPVGGESRAERSVRAHKTETDPSCFTNGTRLLAFQVPASAIVVYATGWNTMNQQKNRQEREGRAGFFFDQEEERGARTLVNLRISFSLSQLVKSQSSTTLSNGTHTRDPCPPHEFILQTTRNDLLRYT